MDYIKIVEELNAELFEKGEQELSFSYETNGFCDIIKFQREILWDSENDEREWLEEKNQYEPFKPFIKKVFNDWIERIESFKL